MSLKLVSNLMISYALLGCSPLKAKHFSEVYVGDFHSDAIDICTTRDVDLSHKQASDFFGQARKVESRTIHDHYDIAPCYIEGTLKYQEESCDWKINAGQFGLISCGSTENYFVCDHCFEMFQAK